MIKMSKELQWYLELEKISYAAYEKKHEIFIESIYETMDILWYSFLTKEDIKYLNDRADLMAVRCELMSDEEREYQRRSFAYGNIKLHNDKVTKELVNEIADKISKDIKK